MEVRQDPPVHRAGRRRVGRRDRLPATSWVSSSLTSPGACLLEWMLVGGWLSHVSQVAFRASADACVVQSGLGETEASVGAAPDAVGVVVVLAVVFPEADGADLGSASRVEGQESAARTGVRAGAASGDVDERFHGADVRVPRRWVA